MGLKFKCLVMDHDDTTVDSSRTVHYPSFVAFCEKYHPEIRLSYEEYLYDAFDPGVVKLFSEICGFDEDEVHREEIFWNDYVKKHTPPAFSGIKELLEEQRRRGGLIVVASQSYKENILRDYRENHLPEPDDVYGWELPKELRKPNPYCLTQIEKKFALKRDDILVVDDLKPGYDMARQAGVHFAASGWGNPIPKIEKYMRKNCGLYFKKVEELYRYLFED